jgi:hypothetical protein
MTDFHLASMMICEMPRLVNNRWMVSACESVWEPLQFVPSMVGSSFTDEVDNIMPTYGGAVQLSDPSALDILDDAGLFACFRGVEQHLLSHVQTVPPSDLYRAISGQLRLVGWDVCTGNGWRSASCSGFFPIHPFTGEVLSADFRQINAYALFGELEACRACCAANDALASDDAPWFPVAVYLTRRALARLSSS